MIIPVKLPLKSYDIVVERGALNHVNELLTLTNKTLILTDSGIPLEYVGKVKELIPNSLVFTIEEGEKSKSIDNYMKILSFMVENNFTRTDSLISLGGGVVGDLGGFVASTYMRGITFYNIPTTLLSEVDSSIGGKTGINYDGIKNIVGSFYQPNKVIIDPNVLKTLDDRLFSEGLAEAIKMSMTFDEELFNLIENSSDIKKDIEEVIIKSLLIKKRVVELDEKESGLRRVLNFGHTIGHAVESLSDGKLFHGEAVSIGMVPLVDEDIKSRLIKVLKKYNLPTGNNYDKEQIIEKIKHDKKAISNEINIILCHKIGTYEIVKMDISDLRRYL